MTALMRLVVTTMFGTSSGGTMKKATTDGGGGADPAQTKLGVRTGHRSFEIGRSFALPSICPLVARVVGVVELGLAASSQAAILRLFWGKTATHGALPAGGSGPLGLRGGRAWSVPPAWLHVPLPRYFLFQGRPLFVCV